MKALIFAFAFAAFMVALVFTVAAAQCTATTKKGKQCSRQAEPGSAYCWQHKK